MIIPDSVTNIGNYAFRGCSGFAGDLVIPNSVTSIGSSVFYGCSGFTGSLVIPDSVTSIGGGAFSGCSGFTGDLVIPNSVTSIGSSAFYGCSGFTGSLVIPNSVISVGDSAFFECSGFTGNLVIPNSVTSIGNFAFSVLSKVDKILIKVNENDESSNYKKALIDGLPNDSQTVIDVPYDFGVNGTWMETTLKRVGKPIIKNVISGVESDLIDKKGESVSLYIPSLYQESNISVLRDGKSYALPIKDSNNKHIFTEAGIYQVTVTTDLGNVSVISFEVEDPRFKEAEKAVAKAEASKEQSDIEYARDLVNKLPECTIKDQLSDRLNNIFPNITIEKKLATAGADVYIKSKNTLSLSLDTNSITFEEVSGVEDIEKQNAVRLTVESSLPYEINSYLESEIQNADKTVTVDKSILNIKANDEATYKIFSSIGTSVQLLDNQTAGMVNSHGVDLKLNKDIIAKADNYKTAIKFEVAQK